MKSVIIALRSLPPQNGPQGANSVVIVVFLAVAWVCALIVVHIVHIAIGKTSVHRYTAHGPKRHLSAATQTGCVTQASPKMKMLGDAAQLNCLKVGRGNA